MAVLQIISIVCIIIGINLLAAGLVCLLSAVKLEKEPEVREKVFAQIAEGQPDWDEESMQQVVDSMKGTEIGVILVSLTLSIGGLIMFIVSIAPNCFK